ncbi:hypothetical protein BJ973_004031 [Actinoplanes tereljensis]
MLDDCDASVTSNQWRQQAGFGEVGVEALG